MTSSPQPSAQSQGRRRQRVTLPASAPAPKKVKSVSFPNETLSNKRTRNEFEEEYDAAPTPHKVKSTVPRIRSRSASRGSSSRTPADKGTGGAEVVAMDVTDTQGAQSRDADGTADAVLPRRIEPMAETGGEDVGMHTPPDKIRSSRCCLSQEGAREDGLQNAKSESEDVAMPEPTPSSQDLQVSVHMAVCLPGTKEDEDEDDDMPEMVCVPKMHAKSDDVK